MCSDRVAAFTCCADELTTQGLKDVVRKKAFKFFFSLLSQERIRFNYRYAPVFLPGQIRFVQKEPKKKNQEPKDKNQETKKKKQINRKYKIKNQASAAIPWSL